MTHYSFWLLFCCAVINAQKNVLPTMNEGTTNGPQMPAFPDMFSYDGEIVNNDFRSATTNKMYYDFTANLSRFDHTYSNQRRNHSAMFKKYGRGPFKIIHDFSTGLQYVIDQKRLNCSIEPIPTKMHDVSSQPHGDVSYVSMRHAQEMMLINATKMQYKGQDTLREIPADVWRGVRVGFPQADSNTTMEIYFSQDNWTYGIAGHTDKQVLIGFQISQMSMIGKKQVPLVKMFFNIYNFDAEEPDLEVFSIQQCFTNAAELIHATFKLPGVADLITENKLGTLVPAIRQSIAKQVGIEPIRVDAIYLDVRPGGILDVWFTLLEHPAVVGDVAAPALPTVTMNEAWRRLQKLVDHAQLYVTVIDGDKERAVYVQQFSLKTDAEALDPRTNDVNEESGYSPGSMAGVGIGMFVVGIAGTLLTIAILNRKNFEIPYLVQE